MIGWSRRQSITLSRASGAVTNYQMKIILPEPLGCQSDFSDIRFTTVSDKVLDYWIESIVGTTPDKIATIWVEFDSIGTTDTIFYLYYGNPDALSVSNGPNTFLFFDDFSGNLSKWSGNVTSAVIDGGICTITNAVSSGDTRVYTPLFSGDIAVRSRTSLGAFNYAQLLLVDVAVSTYTYVMYHSSYPEFSYWGTTVNVTNANIGYGNFQIYELTRSLTDGAKTRYFLNDIQVGTDNATGVPTVPLCAMFRPVIGIGAIQSDWLLIRKYYSVEPEFGAWGSIEVLRLPSLSDKQVIIPSIPTLKTGELLLGNTNSTFKVLPKGPDGSIVSYTSNGYTTTLIGDSPSGVNTSTSLKTILDKTSSIIQVVPGIAGGSVILPDATTMHISFPTYCIVNIGVHPVTVYSYSNVYITSISNMKLLTLKSKPTSTGIWDVISCDMVKTLPRASFMFTGKTDMTMATFTENASSILTFNYDANFNYAIYRGTLNYVKIRPIFFENNELECVLGGSYTSIVRSAITDYVDAIFLSRIGIVYSSLLVYTTGTGAGFGRVVAMTRDGIPGTFALGIEFTFGTTPTNKPKVARLTDTKAIVVYTTGVNSYASVLNITGTTTAIITPVIFRSIGVDSLVILPLTTTTALVLMCSGSIGAGAQVLTVSGNTITYTSYVSYLSSGILEQTACILSPTAVLITYQLYNLSDGQTDTYARIITINGTTITYGYQTLVAKVASSYMTPKVASVSPNLAIITYSNPSLGVVVLDILGTVITPRAITIGYYFNAETSCLHKLDGNTVLYSTLSGADTIHYAIRIN